MPQNHLAPSNNFNVVRQWLNENLRLNANLTTSIVPIPRNINQVPESKGLYFWLMEPAGYELLSTFIPISPIETRFEFEFAGVTYHLVYLGTAGTQRKRRSDLRQRLEWHITQKHNDVAISNGTLSTLRAGIGSLLSNDLIRDAEDCVNEFIQNYFRVYWIPYTHDEIDLIDSDELTLIKVLKPLLNIRNNPNATRRAQTNPTQSYRLRRNQIYLQTREKVCSAVGTMRKKVKTPHRASFVSPVYEHQVLSEKSATISFTIRKEQSIQDVINGIENIPTGKCEIVIYNYLNPADLVYQTKRGKRRITGSKGQNVRNYFSNQDGRVPRWRIIQKEMTDKKIHEAVVEIYAIENESKGSYPPNLLVPIQTKISNMRGCRKHLIILPCSAEKYDGKGTCKNGLNTYFFNPQNGMEVEALIDTRNIRYQISPLSYSNPPQYKYAWDLYNGQLYTCLKMHQPLINEKIDAGKLDIIIISGGYGVVNYNSCINNYDIKIDGFVRFWEKVIPPAIIKYIADNEFCAVHSFLRPNTYHIAATGGAKLHVSHTAIWADQVRGRPMRGVKNIYNNIAGKVISLIVAI